MSERELPDESADNEADQTRDVENDLQPREYGGPVGKEPTRYGDWEKNGRCIDF